MDRRVCPYLLVWQRVNLNQSTFITVVLVSLTVVGIERAGSLSPGQLDVRRNLLDCLQEKPFFFQEIERGRGRVLFFCILPGLPIISGVVAPIVKKGVTTE